MPTSPKKPSKNSAKAKTKSLTVKTSGHRWTIEYLQSTIKTFKKIDPQDRKRIRSFLEDRLARLNDPRQLGKALQGSSQDFWRYRVGNYRIICDVRDEALVVLVVKVGHRKEIYR